MFISVTASIDGATVLCSCERRSLTLLTMHNSSNNNENTVAVPADENYANFFVASVLLFF